VARAISTDVGGPLADVRVRWIMGKTVTQLQICDEPGPRGALIAHNACKVLYTTATMGKRVSDIIGLRVELLLPDRSAATPRSER